MLFASFSHLWLGVRLILCVLLAGVILNVGNAQDVDKNPSQAIPPTTEPTVNERVRHLETELEKQNVKLDQLQKTIAEQQLAIQALLTKLSEEKHTESTNGNTSVATSAAATNPTSPGVNSTAVVTQAPTIEQRLDKVEAQALRIGPLRITGDFRLRFDGTFRSATEPGDPPVAHAQNARARYRFRLNFDTDIYRTLSFHGQLTTGPINNGVTSDQDFGGINTRAPFFISEAWIDYHPTRSIQIQGGRVQNVFADNSRFMFDDDTRLNGFNERYTAFLKGNPGYFSSVEFRAGQYILGNPNVAIVTPGSPLARAGEIVGTSGRSANLFHQGVLFNQRYNEKWTSQFGGDIQLYRNANQVALASTNDGAALIIQPGIGLALSGPLTGSGTATTTPGGAIFTASGFQVARLTYRLNYSGFKKGDHLYPVVLNIQAARNVATGLNERDALLAALQVGRITKKGDKAFLYVFTIKGANALISQLTDDDLGTGSGVNVRTHHFRFEYGISRKVTFQSLIFMQQSLRSSGQYPNFFVPLGSFVPRQYRVQQQLVFNF